MKILSAIGRTGGGFALDGIPLTSVVGTSYVGGTGLTEITGSFADDQSWIDGYILGTEYVSDGSDLSTANWHKGNVTIDGTDGIVSSAVSTSHYVWNTMSEESTEDDVFYISVKLKAGATDFVWVNYYETNIAESNHICKVDLTDLSTLTVCDGVYDEQIIGPDSNGFYTFSCKFILPETDTYRIYIYPATSISSVTYTGDGSTVDIYAKEVSIKEITYKLSDHAGEGYMIRATDGDGNEATGFLGAQCSGWAYDSELVTNGDFESNVDNWNDNGSGSTLSWETGKYLKLTESGGSASNTFAVQNISVGQHKLFNYYVKVKAGTEASYRIRVYDLTNSQWIQYSSSAEASSSLLSHSAPNSSA
jgi:hypothetical protein